MDTQQQPSGRQPRGPLVAGIGLGAMLGLILALTWSALAGRKDAQAASATAPPATDTSTLTQAPRSTRATPPRPAATAPAPSSMLQPSEAEMKASVLRQQAQHEAVWAKDKVDPQAATKLERHIADVMENPRMRSELRNMPSRYEAHCKASLCRIEATFASRMDDSDSWLTRFLIDVGGDTVGNVTTLSLPQDDGSKKVVLYAYRPGHSPANP